MALGFSKDFILFLVLSIIIAIGTENWRNFFVFMGLYITIKIVWRILT